jgi:hypothetical protein
MSSLALVHELNNLGVAALELEEYDRAMEFFRHALRQAKSVIHHSCGAITTAASAASAGTVTPAPPPAKPQEDQQDEECSSRRPSKRVKREMPTTTMAIPVVSPIDLSCSTNIVRKCLAAQPVSPKQASSNSNSNSNSNCRSKRDQSDPRSLFVTRGLYMLDGPVTTRIAAGAAGAVMEQSPSYSACRSSGPCFSHDLLEEAKIHCAIVVFNLGLVSQRSGQQSHCTASVQASTLQQSKILYFQAYKLLASLVMMEQNTTTSDTSSAGRGVSSGNALLDLLYMAVLNNWLQATLECESFATSGPQRTSEQLTLQISARLIRLAMSVRSSSQYCQTTALASLCSLAEFCLVNASAARLLPRTIAPAA